MRFALSVPANLLLLGEYAVTEEGGLGIALATSPRALVSLEDGVSLEIFGKMGPSSFAWREDREAAPPLIDACLAEARRHLKTKLDAAGDGYRLGWPLGHEGARIHIDSSAFFAADGSKLGFGSSAAVAVGLCAALLRLGGLEGETLETAIFPVALAAHRRAQGGRGSGYDVAASRHGGLGLFEGGASPRWTPLPAPARRALGRLSLSLRPGPGPVSSPAAVERYRQWASREVEAQGAYLAATAEAAHGFAAASEAESILGLLEAAAARGMELGEAIAVPARPASGEGPEGSRTLYGGATIGTIEKCLGAGDELVLVATMGGGIAETRAQGHRLCIENEGLRWE
ncbi:MAG TPA: hypothetical protein VMV44_02475 [Rectinemataceae bacterium]|nr:hypothetical protein [Rectinemataceae bacterium]